MKFTFQQQNVFSLWNIDVTELQRGNSGSVYFNASYMSTLQHENIAKDKLLSFQAYVYI